MKSNFWTVTRKTGPFRTPFPAVHGTQDLNLPDRIQAELARNSIPYQLFQRGGDLLRIVALHEMEIGLRRAPNLRHSAFPDSVGQDDLTARRLPEHLGKTHHRHQSAIEQIAEDIARADGWNLVHIPPGSATPVAAPLAKRNASARRPPWRSRP